MARLNPYLRFNGNAREAFEFYKGCLGGTVSLLTVAQSPFASQMPGQKDLIFHGELTSDNLVLQGSDMVGPGGLSQGNSMALALTCDDLAQAQKIFPALSAGGSEVNPMAKRDFGTIGSVRDKFGNEWFVFVP